MRRLLALWAVFLVGLIVISGAGAAVLGFWFAHANGAQEVPVRATDATGNAIFTLARDGRSIAYVLTARNLDNVIMAHIHLAPPGVNGPIVVWLYPSTTPDVRAPAGGGPANPILAHGVFTADDLVGPLAGKSLADLITALNTNNAYVNYHTDDGVPPPNTGPGDFPGGEIRGNIRGFSFG
jgi:CHRD domain